FKPLGREEIIKIIDLLVRDIQKRLDDRNISLTLTENAKQYIASESYSPTYGARPVRRFLQKQLETEIGRLLIRGSIEDNSSILVDKNPDVSGLQIRL
ncbi:MAG: type VI secretion system ATPase TssH, partial [Clostridiales bacterium]|nr:type VI secretion system ATPase TssH [Clostridiales bacterium]